MKAIFKKSKLERNNKTDSKASISTVHNVTMLIMRYLDDVLSIISNGGNARTIFIVSMLTVITRWNSSRG